MEIGLGGQIRKRGFGKRRVLILVLVEIGLGVRGVTAQVSVFEES